MNTQIREKMKRKRSEEEMLRKNTKREKFNNKKAENRLTLYIYIYISVARQICLFDKKERILRTI